MRWPASFRWPNRSRWTRNHQLGLSMANEHPKGAETAMQKQFAPRPIAKTAQPTPTAKLRKIDVVAEVRCAILAIIKNDLEPVVSHWVNAPVWSSIGRSEYPQPNYKDCGSTALGDFLKNHCVQVAPSS